LKISIFLLSDEIEAHKKSKVTCIEIGETGRVLVTGGQDRLVNLFAFGNSDCSLVSTSFIFRKNSFIENIKSKEKTTNEQKKYNVKRKNRRNTVI
jgi:hypothetical protein